MSSAYKNDTSGVVDHDDVLDLKVTGGYMKKTKKCVLFYNSTIVNNVSDTQIHGPLLSCSHNRTQRSTFSWLHVYFRIFLLASVPNKVS